MRSDSRTVATLAAIALAAMALTSCLDVATPTDGEPPPTLQTVTTQWIAPLASGGSIAVDESFVYAATVGEPVQVLSRSTGALVRTFENAGFTYTGGLVAIDGTLLVATRQLRRLDRLTGAARWEYPAALASNGTLLVNDSLVYVTANGSGANGPVLHAVRLQQGTARWVDTIPIPAGVTRSPGDVMVLGGVTLRGDVLVATYAYVNDALLTLASAVVAYHAASGALLWRADLSLNGTRPGPPAVGSGVVVVTDGQGNSYGYQVQTGTLQWTSPRMPSGSVAANPLGGVALTNGTYAVTSEGLIGLSGLDPATGTKHWRAIDLSYSTNALLTVHPNGQLVAVNALGELVGLSIAANPAVLWRVVMPLTDRARALAVRDDVMYVLSSSGVRALTVAP